MRITPNMGLTAPASNQDIYSWTVNAQNLYLTDYHDHSPGRGTSLTGSSIVPGSLSGLHITPGSLTTQNLSIVGLPLAMTALAVGETTIGTSVTLIGSVTFTTPLYSPSACNVLVELTGQMINTSGSLINAGFAVATDSGFSTIIIQSHANNVQIPGISGTTQIYQRMRIASLALNTTYTYYIGASTTASSGLSWYNDPPIGGIASLISVTTCL